LSNKSGSTKERNQTSSELGTGSDQSSVRSWLVQPIKESSSAAELCAGRGCALIRQLANSQSRRKPPTHPPTGGGGLKAVKGPHMVVKRPYTGVKGPHRSEKAPCR